MNSQDLAFPCDGAWPGTIRAGDSPNGEKRMNNCIRIAAILAVSILLSGCLATLGKGIRQSDLDAWRGVPVKALDVHP
ncbi:MAG: hypothetical protein F4X92_09175, partial [Gammaproteobacteria bacterium]|nr:hypothetical protein [Gammaproteobacteria bacterium]